MPPPRQDGPGAHRRAARAPGVAWDVARASSAGNGTKRLPRHAAQETRGAPPPPSEEAFFRLHPAGRLTAPDLVHLLVGERAVVDLIARQSLSREVRERHVYDLRLRYAEGIGHPHRGFPGHSEGGIPVAVAQQYPVASDRLTPDLYSPGGHGTS